MSEVDLRCAKNHFVPFATVNPATGQTEKTFPAHTAAEVERRLQGAMDAFGEYRATTYAARARHLITAAELLEGEGPAVARTMTTEMGKTFAAARGEVSKCALGLRWFAQHAEDLLADEPIETSAARSYVRYQPLGPVLAIMPWNIPLWQVIRFAAPALMAGNVGLLKHAANVPQTALLLEDLFRRAGLPEGVFTNLFVETEAIAGIIEDPRVAAVTLTGSERAGMSVAATAGHALKKSVLELGGSDPFIVLASADLDMAVRTAGDGPGAEQRAIVYCGQALHRGRAGGRRVPAAFHLRHGLARRRRPVRPRHRCGADRLEAQRAELVAQVGQRPCRRGRSCMEAATALEGPGWYFAPTVLSGVTPDMRVANEEIFGPVAVVERVADLDHALEVANATSFGLGSSVWTHEAGEQ